MDVVPRSMRQGSSRRSGKTPESAARSAQFDAAEAGPSKAAMESLVEPLALRRNRFDECDDQALACTGFKACGVSIPLSWVLAGGVTGFWNHPRR